MKTNLTFLSIVAFVSIVVNALLAFFIFNLSSSDTFEKTPMFVQDFNNSNDSIIFIDYNYDNLTEEDKYFLSSQLVKQYIVDRYTFIPDQNYFDSKLGVWYEKGGRGADLGDPRFPLGIINTFDFNKGKSNSVWIRFKDPKVGQYNEFEDMLKDGVTQQVEIVREPRLEKEYWVVVINIYRKELGKPTTVTRKIVQLRVQLEGVLNPAALEERPEFYFKFIVQDFKDE